jgi:ribosomal protein S18 acetylase RimI-like enzyme
VISIRPFEDGDNRRMLDIEKLCPQGNEKCAMGVDKKGDIIARYRMYDNWNVLVAEEAGEVAGWIGWTVKLGSDNGDKYVYLTEAMVHPEFRRKGIATRLIEEAEKNARENRADYTYCYIYGQNDASSSLVKGLGYSPVVNLKAYAVPTYKEAVLDEKFSIESIRKEEIPEAVSLINRYNNGLMHFEPYTVESFSSHLDLIPAYGLENFWAVKEDKKITACAGLWDSSAISDMYYAREPFSWKAMKAISEFLRPLVKMPKIAAEGERFKIHYLTDHAFEKDHSDAMSNLLGHINNHLQEVGRDYYMATIDPKDNVSELLKKLQPMIEPYDIFAKALDGELPGFSPFYVDIRDMIL